MGAPDVAIIGAGIAGTSLAAELARRGLRVTVYERARVAAAASGRNSGAIWHPSDPVLAALYVETLALYRALPGRLAPHLPGHPFRLGDEPAGLLALGRDETALRALAEADAAADPALSPRYVGPDELRAMEPSLAEGLAAVRYGICFPVTPAGATRAMADLARVLGAVVLEGVDVRGLVRDGARATGVRTGRGLEPAGAVVVAAGPWTPGLVDPGGTWRPIRPFWGVVVDLALEAPPRHVLEAAPIDEAGGGPRSVPGFSLVTAGGRSSLGSTFLPEEPDPGAWEPHLRAGGAAYVPAIAQTPAAGVRACARPVTPDGRPLEGAVPGIDGLYVVAGHGPWGMSTAPASAAHVAALVAGEPDPRTPAVLAGTDAARFGTPPA